MFDDSRFNESQRRALAAEGNVLVSASAGSGKTTVMIEKIFRLIASGKDVRRMVVMTFSRAAASEMKNRLVRRLTQEARVSSDVHLRRQLEAFPFANICTIDSFCYSLIKKYFAVIGADPSAKPLDPDESALWLEDAVDKACEEKLLSDGAFVAFAERYSSARRLDNVKNLIKELRKFLKVQSDAQAFLTERREAVDEYFLNDFRRRIRTARDRLTEARYAVVSAEMTEEEGKINVALASLDKLYSTAGAEEFFRTAKFLVPFSKCTKRKDIYLAAKGLYNEAAECYKDLISAIESYSSAFYDVRGNATNGADCRALLDVTLCAEELYGRRKASDGKLDFDDMGGMALRILADERVCAEVRASYDYIFVDEYQDVNYLNESLLMNISDGSNVFAVGDVKQAIYHFRFAEPGIFHDRMERYETLREGRNILLNENYRSREEILEFVNACCSEVMTEEFCSIDYRHGNMMRAGTESADRRRSVDIYFLPEERESVDLPKIYSVKEAECYDAGMKEARFVADLIAATVAGEEIACAGKSARKINYGDIAVLTRRRSEYALVARALQERDIPYSVGDAEEDTFAPRELLVDFIRLCVNASDATVVNLLLSPVFAFTPAELMEIRFQSPKTSIYEAVKTYNGDEVVEEKCRYFIDYAEETRELSEVLSVDELMQRALSDGLDGYYLSLGGAVSARIYKFLATVRRLECAHSTRDFLEYYEASYKGERPPAKKDGVTLMTMHKSKGLEFPVVILPSTHVRAVGTSASRSSLFCDRELGIALKSVDEEQGYAGDNFATKVQKLKKSNEEREELARLMYVAFTRAECRLIVTGKVKKAPSDLFCCDCIADFINYAAEKNPLLKGYFREIPSFVRSEAEAKEKRRADFSYLFCEYPYLESTVTPNKMSVSEILERETGVADPFGSRNASNAELGTAYHTVMQKIDLNARGASEVEESIRRLTEEGEIEKETADRLDREKIALLMRSEVMELARGAKCYREQPFMSYETAPGGDRVLVQGVIDLLIEEEDGLTVVDYKASALSERKLSLRYRKQLELYAQAAGKIWGKPVKRRILFNILQNYTVLL